MNRRTATASAGLVLMATGAVLVWHGLSPASGPPSLPASASIAGSAATAAPTREASAGITRVVPTRIVIPAIGVDAAVVSEGTDASGALEMPPLSEQNVAGWWDGGAAPGQDGPAVIAGHVDNTGGPLVFWRLRELKPGDTVMVDPARVTFTVTRITQVAKSAFPTASVYGPVKDPELRLVSCGGTYDAATGHYLSNVIVYATERRPAAG